MPAPHEQLKSTLENKGIKFHIKTSNAKWHCTVLDRATHEKRKVVRTDSASSVSTTDSSNSSGSSTKSH
ncbi:hypothetical protein N0V88_002957 [Collariella sp. IMI 366227]|nr:hypothetical protein N0V88_002957 [Collariella sp. IMI 366227]